MDSTQALDLQDVPSSLLVIGGGYIGLEMGTVYAALGSRVSVVELTDGLLPGADRDLVKPLHERLKRLFHAIHLKHKVVQLTDLGEAIEVVFEGDEGRLTDRFDRVLVSIGRRPNSSGIGLEKTKVKLTDTGFVIVDERRRTTDSRIYAIGDVAGEPMLAHKAAHEGKVAVESIHGGPALFDKMAIPAVVFTDPEIAWAGLTEGEAGRNGREIRVAQYPWAASGRAQAVGRTDGLTKLIIDPETERILGVGIVGSGAGELIAEGVLAIEMGCTARDLAESVHPHPTLSETLGHSADAFYGLATEIYKPRRAK
jgi:dihydrolipoamide dehydrogenase